ncbi:YybS family protein [Halalkalibacter urbisdiaboli]|uniref:YybS family protein n=1 Tax=Halalkalibacter urbisdiaboli TaxID=1960589 RepID=UPI000B438936|nr:YybS family protein [Halalkalibacter urbisdiaboli]
MKRTRILTEGAILASLFTVFLLVNLYVPLISIVTLWVLPLPFIVFVVRRGLKPGLMLWAITLILALIVGSLPALPQPLVFGSAGLVIGELYRRKAEGFSILIGGSLIYTFNMLMAYLALVLFMDENPMRFFATIIREQIQLTESTLESFGQVPDESLKAMYDIMDMLVYLAPVMIILMGLILAVITITLATLILRRLGHEVKGLPPFREWRFPKSFLWYYLIVMVIAMIGVEEGTTLFLIIWNLYPLLEMILAVQGFAVIFYYCHYKKMNKALPILIVFAAFILSPLLYLIRILGIIDLGFDLRNRLTSQKK